ncbi:MAG: D-alanyl-D-alanine carboxypeptidase family protein [Actinomycetota bacterium]
MNEIDQPDSPQTAAPRRALTDEERRVLLEKRIKELRRRKKRDLRRSNRPLRITTAVFLLVFLALFVVSGIYTLAASGESERYLASVLPASNLPGWEGLLLETEDVRVPAISAAAAILVDPATDDVLFEHNADQPLPMASTTKVMTAVVVLENASLQESVTVSAYAGAVGESSAWLDAGEVLTVEQLLYALLLQSANDAAVALAEHVGGSEGAFVEMMNEKARDMGLGHTSFANPHGLDAPNHYTSARDLAAITCYAMDIAEYRRIAETTTYELPWPGHPFPRVLENHNKLLKTYPGTTGGKTGYTAGAGKCLVASSQREGRELVSVILNGGDGYWDQTTALMDYGYDYFTPVEYAYSGQPLARVEVGDFPRREVDATCLEDLVFTVRRDRLEGYEEATVNSLEWVAYPVAEGQEMGQLVIAAGTPHESEEALVASEARRTPNLAVRILAFIAAVFGTLWAGIKWIIPGL